jgi:hypothetical protein
MLESTIIVNRNPRVEYRALGEGEGGVLLHMDTAAYHGLNEIGSLVWSLLDDISFEDLIAKLQTRLEDLPPTFDEEISEFLDELAVRDLVLYGTTTDQS